MTGLGLDVVFPVLHGPFGEDGTVQGLLELANVPYVGAGVLASAVGMDKAFMKVAFAARGLPIVRVPRRAQPRLAARTGDAELGSHRGARLSGVRQAGQPRVQRRDLEGEDPRRTWRRPWIWPSSSIARWSWKQAVPNAREIEVRRPRQRRPAGLGRRRDRPPGREFYDYEAKYLDDGSTPHHPRGARPSRRRPRCGAWRSKRSARSSAPAWRASTSCSSRDSGRLYVNEINTIPGFTTISMFSKLWGATGVDYPALLDRLIKLAIERHAEKQRLKTSVL